ncbi:MAG: diadenylate cyclase CdaA [Bacteroidales bacterium]
MFQFFGIKDIVDIILVALLLYYCYRMMKASGSLSIFVGLLAITGVWIVVSHILQMRLIGNIMDKFISVGGVALVVLFQEEIRRFLLTLGSHKRWKYIYHLIRPNKDEVEIQSFMPIVIACRNMAKQRCGALIVIEENVSLQSYKTTGEAVDGVISTRLIENIFFKNSPLHDGAMIISENKIAAVGCILPVSHSRLLPKEMGLRHRAALGITQETDAKAIIVSEERGRISFAYKGEMHKNITPEELESLLST